MPKTTISGKQRPLFLKPHRLEFPAFANSVCRCILQYAIFDQAAHCVYVYVCVCVCVCVRACTRVLEPPMRD